MRTDRFFARPWSVLDCRQRPISQRPLHAALNSLMMDPNSLPHCTERRILAIRQQHLRPRYPARRLGSRPRKSLQSFNFFVGHRQFDYSPPRLRWWRSIANAAVPMQRQGCAGSTTSAQEIATCLTSGQAADADFNESSRRTWSLSSFFRCGRGCLSEAKACRSSSARCCRRTPLPQTVFSWALFTGIRAAFECVSSHCRE